MRKLLYILLLAIPMFFAQTFIHESSHALMGIAQNLSVKEFKPYPHMVDGRLFLGRVSYKPNSGFKDSIHKVTLRAGAPFIVGLPLFFLLFGLRVILFVKNKARAPFSSAFVNLATFMPSVDVGNGLLQAFWEMPYTDIHKVSVFGHIPIEQLQLGALVFISVAVICLCYVIYKEINSKNVM